VNRLDVALLRGLRQASGWTPVSDFAQALQVDPARIRERLGELNAAGFQIEDRPGHGIRLMGETDRLVGDDLLSRMGEGAWLREVVVFEETSSTNDQALRLGRSGADAGVLFVAERQTAGRGRFGRVWESAPHAGLWCSVLLRPAIRMDAWPRLTTAAAVGLARGMELSAPIQVKIKWPNDLYWNGRKLGGILMETGVDARGEPFAVLGFGINVNQERFPEPLQGQAASVRIAAGGAFQDRPALAARVLDCLGAALHRAESGGFGELLEEARRRSLMLGHWVRLEQAENRGGALIEGIAESLDSEGRLEVRLAGGGVVQCTGGEVTVLSGGWQSRAG
jgi:BirA family biotin operon repressor/biotin-[acetyl-CoA-carboxylase] ligase